MGEDRIIWNVDKCEYIVASRNYVELYNILDGKDDWADWEYAGGLKFALLLGLTPHISFSPFGLYERYHGRWAGNRIIATGDYTRVDSRVYEMCNWVDITDVVELALAEMFMSLATTAQGERQKKYRAVAIRLLRYTLEDVYVVMHPSAVVKKMAKTVMETGSLDLAVDEAIRDCDKEYRYCKRIEEEFDVEPQFYIGVDCRCSAGDEQLKWLDESRAFEMLFREDGHLAVPSNVVYAFNAFMRMMEGRLEQEC